MRCVVKLIAVLLILSFTFPIVYNFYFGFGRMHSADVSFHFPPFYSDTFGELYFVKRFDENQSVIWLCGIVVGPSDIPCEPIKSLCRSLLKSVSVCVVLFMLIVLLLFYYLSWFGFD